MTDYSKMKNAELEALLKQRGLPHGGKKADMVARLQEDDSKTEAPKASAAEDEIDWDDEEPTKAPAAEQPSKSTTAPKAPSAASTTTVPSVTATKVVPASPAKPNSTETKTAETAEPKDGVSTEPAEETTRAKTPVDFSIGLASSTIDEEIEKRKARAKKFGTEMDPLAEEALRKLERAKKFGEAGGPRGLNEALPERQKRRHEDGDARGDFKRRGGRGGRFHGHRRRGQGAPTGSQPSGVEKKAGGPTWMTDSDKAAAERRRARFAGPSAQ